VRNLQVVNKDQSASKSSAQDVVAKEATNDAPSNNANPSS